MRPRLLTVRNFVLLVIALALLGGSAYWVKLGMPLPGAGVPSTAGRIAYVTNSGVGGVTHLGMMNADGSDPVALTDGSATDRLPAWSPSGSDIAFVSENRAGVNPQIFEMHAMKGANIGQLTRTDSAKDSPVFGRDNRVYFLDAGKLTSVSADGADTTALLPNHDQRMPGPGGHGDIFAAGGIQQAAPSPDGKHLAAVMHTERADALLFYDSSEDQQALYLVGLADHIRFSFLPDGTMAAVFRGGQPFQQPILLFSKDTDAIEQSPTRTADQERAVAGLTAARALLIDPDSVPSDQRPPMDKSSQLVAIFDPSGQGVGGFPMTGIAPENIFASPDGEHMVITSEQEKNGGVFLVTQKSGQIRQVFPQPTSDATWSPDGGQFAFASGDAIYVAGVAEGAAAPKKISGSGKFSSPAWSPARAKH